MAKETTTKQSPRSVKKKSTIWLSYDLGVRGDYDGLYAWLDQRAARECGDTLAVFQYEWIKDLFKELKTDLEESVTFDKRSRIYVIYRHREEDKNKGKFLVGGRKAAPWVGYGPSPVGDADEDS